MEQDRECPNSDDGKHNLHRMLDADPAYDYVYFVCTYCDYNSGKQIVGRKPLD